MTRIALFSFALALSSTALAGGGRDAGTSTTFSDYSDGRPVSTEAEITADDAESFSIAFLGSDDSMRGVTEYDFAVGRDLYTVSLASDVGEGIYSLYDEKGRLVVGYTVSADGISIFDSAGTVESHEPGKASFAVMEEYGTAATLLSDPSFLMSFMDHEIATSGPDGDIQALPIWVGVVAIWALRCIDVSINFDSEGFTSGSIAIDC